MCCGQGVSRGKNIFSHFQLLEEKWYLSINWHEKEGKSWLVGKKKMSALLNQCFSSSKSCTTFLCASHFKSDLKETLGRKGSCDP